MTAAVVAVESTPICCSLELVSSRGRRDALAGFFTFLLFFRGVTAKGFAASEFEGAERSGAAVAGTEMLGADRPPAES